jgi:hypothetical protein
MVNQEIPNQVRDDRQCIMVTTMIAKTLNFATTLRVLGYYTPSPNATRPVLPLPMFREQGESLKMR